MTKEAILSRIRRAVRERNGRIGLAAFLKATGIPQRQFLGKHWATWNEALREAGIVTASFKKPRTPEESVLEAFAQLLAGGRDLELVLAGKKDPAYPEIPSVIARLGLVEKVIMTDFVSDADLIALTSGARVFVFPSLYEGFGLPPLEAMALGVPVACSERTSLPEVCSDAALYFDPENVEDMAKKLKELVENNALRSQCMERGEKNLERFSWSKAARQILDIFKTVCNNNRQTKFLEFQKK